MSQPSLTLTDGSSVLVDESDLGLLCALRWTRHSQGYAWALNKLGRGPRMVLMHRVIMGVYESSRPLVDHINHNKLDNRKSNLRLCTHRGNQANRRVIPNKTSQFKGVRWLDTDGVWMARVAGRHVGRFATERQAALAYDAFMYERYGAFAQLNLPHELTDVATATKERLQRVRPAANITEDIVRAIRASSEPRSVLAERYGVSGDVIYLARTGRTWGHIR